MPRIKHRLLLSHHGGPWALPLVFVHPPGFSRPYYQQTRQLANERDATQQQKQQKQQPMIPRNPTATKRTAWPYSIFCASYLSPYQCYSSAADHVAISCHASDETSNCVLHLTSEPAQAITSIAFLFDLCRGASIRLLDRISTSSDYGIQGAYPSVESQCN